MELDDVGRENFLEDLVSVFGRLCPEKTGHFASKSINWEPFDEVDSIQPIAICHTHLRDQKDPGRCYVRKVGYVDLNVYLGWKRTTQDFGVLSLVDFRIEVTLADKKDIRLLKAHLHPLNEGSGFTREWHYDFEGIVEPFGLSSCHLPMALSLKYDALDKDSTMTVTERIVEYIDSEVCHEIDKWKSKG